MSYTLKLTNDQICTIINKYDSFSLPHTNNYTTFRAKINSSTVTIFKTGNVLIQGSDEKGTYNEICVLLNITPTFDLDNKSITNLNNSVTINELKNIIGTDEVGTGDFFGSIIVVGCFVPAYEISYLQKLGIKDSKELSDEKILSIAPKLMEKFTYTYSELDNIHYNYLVFKLGYNMNQIKAVMHNSVINSMKTKVEKYDKIVVDAFTNETNYYNYLAKEKVISKDISLEEKAENKYVAVGCASIIARYLFLKSMDKLSEKVKLDIPKGAGKPVDIFLVKYIQEFGTKDLKYIAKLNFKNYRKLLDQKS